MNKITTFYLKDLEFILHYITLTLYYILKTIHSDDKSSQQHRCEKQNNRLNKITTTHSIYFELTLHYTKITSYNIVKDTLK